MQTLPTAPVSVIIEEVAPIASHAHPIAPPVSEIRAAGDAHTAPCAMSSSFTPAFARVDRKRVATAIAQIKAHVGKETWRRGISKTVKIETHGDGVTLTATNGDTFAAATIPSRQQAPFAVCVPLPVLEAVLKATSDEEIVLSHHVERKHHFIRVQYGRGHFKLCAMPVTDFPAMPEIDKTAHTFRCDGAQLSAALSEVLPFVSGDTYHSAIIGIGCSIEGGILKLSATDGHRLKRTSIAVLPSDAAPVDAVLPAPVAKAIAAAAKDKTEVLLSFDRGRFHAGFDKLTIAAKPLPVHFPDMSKAENITVAGTVTVDRRDIEAALKRLQRISKSDENRVTLHQNGALFYLVAQSAEHGTATEEINCTTSGKIMPPVVLNAAYIESAVKSTPRPKGAKKTDAMPLVIEHECNRSGFRINGAMVMPLSPERSCPLPAPYSAPISDAAPVTDAEPAPLASVETDTAAARDTPMDAPVSEIGTAGVIVRKEDHASIMETCQRGIAQKTNTEKHSAVPLLKRLRSLSDTSDAPDVISEPRPEPPSCPTCTHHGTIERDNEHYCTSCCKWITGPNAGQDVRETIHAAIDARRAAAAARNEQSRKRAALAAEAAGIRFDEPPPDPHPMHPTVSEIAAAPAAPPAPVDIPRCRFCHLRRPLEARPAATVAVMFSGGKPVMCAACAEDPFNERGADTQERGPPELPDAATAII